ncbi:MAG: elongation factor Ts, partial [Halieaceae bacterium]
MSAALVKELRERTGLGLLECKKALAEAGNDVEA